MTHEDYQKAAEHWAKADAASTKMNPERLLVSIQTYIQDNNTCALATGYDGFIRCTPIEYSFHNGAFYLLSEGGLKFKALEQNKNVCLAIFDQYEGFGKLKGLQIMYKHYLQVMPNAQYPYASCAFFNLISTNADAYKVWGEDVGDYPSLPSINVDRTQFGNGTLDGTTFTQKAGEATVFPCLNDPSSNWWLNKGGAVVETPSYIGANYTTVIDFIDKCIAAK